MTFLAILFVLNFVESNWVILLRHIISTAKVTGSEIHTFCLSYKVTSLIRVLFSYVVKRTGNRI
jgi:hypothetical protein